MSAAPHASTQAEVDIIIPGAQRSGTIRLSAVPHTSVCSQHLAVVSEAMLRLASLLRTDHMLGGAQSSTFIMQLNLAIKNVAEELWLDER